MRKSHYLFVIGHPGAWNNLSEGKEAADMKKKRSIEQKVALNIDSYIHTCNHIIAKISLIILGLYKSASWTTRKWKDDPW
jgi:hypothetical protein